MSSSNTFCDFDDWQKRRLHEGAPEITDAQAREFLIQACARDDSRAISRIFEETPSWIFSEGASEDETHPIVACMAMESRRCFKTFLTHSDCELWSLSHGRSLLHFAVEIGALWAAQDLLDAGADISLADRFGFTALAWARATGQEEMVQALSQKAQGSGVNIDRVGAIDFNVLSSTLVEVSRIICEQGDARSSKDLAYLKNRCAVFKRMGFEADERPALCALVWSMGISLNRGVENKLARVTEAISFAIEMGASHDAKAPSGFLSENTPCSALEMAASFINPDAFDALIATGAKREELPAPAAALAWRALLSRQGHFGSATSTQMDFLERLSNEDHFWPPFALNRAAAEEFLSSNASLKNDKQRRQRLGVALEAFELSLSAPPSSKPGKGAPRV